MNRIRFTVASLMGAVLLFGVGIASLVQPEFLIGVWCPLTFGLLLSSSFGIAYSRGRRRAFWVGFCVFGWSYTAILFVNIWLELPMQLYSVLDGLFIALGTRIVRGVPSRDVDAAYYLQTLVINAKCISIVVFGLIGGFVSNLFAAKNHHA
jgi:hypothetical protein